MIKKALWLTSMALAASAWVVPVSASAGTDVWTTNGFTLGAGNEATASFEGALTFSTPGTGTFKCPITVKIKAQGPSQGEVESFEPTTGECVGDGAFKNCELIDHFSVLPWKIDIAATPGTWSEPIHKLTIHYKYKNCVSSILTTHLVFNTFSVVPSKVGGVLCLALSGTATNGVTTISGSITQELDGEGEPLPEQGLLGIETIS